ncbi:MAG: hypothetical protein HQK62_00780 [Desulfamplus sp.]|nr:hypothetical protein [Desulfamplus sp.]
MILSESGLKLTGKVRVRHLLDVLSVDVGAQLIANAVLKKGFVQDGNSVNVRCTNVNGGNESKSFNANASNEHSVKESNHVKKCFDGFTFAPYYGCQCLRPYSVFDDPELPCSMEPLIKATGAKIHSWSMGAKCCGASHINTDPDVSLNLVKAILMNAKGADAIITVCPMCHMNLEAYQEKISSMCHEELKIPVLYLPQLIGLAMGMSNKDVRLDLNLSVPLNF